MIAYLIKTVINLYLIMLFIRVVGSWFPSFAHTSFMRFIAYYTDPYLNIFRKIIPPIGGMLDLSPLLGFFALQIIEVILLKCFS